MRSSGARHSAAVVTVSVTEVRMDKQTFSESRRTVLRQSLGLGALAIGGFAPRVLAQQSQTSPPAAIRQFVEVETHEGRLRGLREQAVCVFRGVRYAGAPVGQSRFRIAPPLQNWKGVRDAVTWGHP